MKATPLEVMEALKQATSELTAAEEAHKVATVAAAETAKVLDLARRRHLNLEQELRRTVRAYVGGSGTIF